MQWYKNQHARHFLTFRGLGLVVLTQQRGKKQNYVQ